MYLEGIHAWTIKSILFGYLWHNSILWYTICLNLVACPKFNHIYRIRNYDFSMRILSLLWYDTYLRYPLMDIFLYGICSICLSNIRCNWWEVSKKNWIFITFRLTIWSRMWFFYNAIFHYRCSLSYKNE